MFTPLIPHFSEVTSDYVLPSLIDIGLASHNLAVRCFWAIDAEQRLVLLREVQDATSLRSSPLVPYFGHPQRGRGLSSQERPPWSDGLLIGRAWMFTDNGRIRCHLGFGIRIYESRSMELNIVRDIET